jgi:hypothetical protein
MDDEFNFTGPFLYFILLFFFLFSFFFYYSYVHTRLGSLLPPAPIQGLFDQICLIFLTNAARNHLES